MSRKSPYELKKEKENEKRPVVQLNDDEYVLSITTGGNRAETYESTPVNKSPIDSNTEGGLGEMLSCVFLEVEFNNSITEAHGDSDIVIGDRVIDVKTMVGYDNPWLLIKEGVFNNGDATDYLLVSIPEYDTLPRKGRIIGWRTHEWIEENREPTYKYEGVEFGNEEKRWRNYVVPSSGLRPPQELKDEIPEEYRVENIVKEPISEVLEQIDMASLGYRFSQSGLSDWEGE